MSKRNITYVKPEEPSFLKKIKEQAGYKEGPTVDTKREDLGPIDERDLQDADDEQPTVVVLNPGDLTAEEAAKTQENLEKEEKEAAADLNKPIVFKAPSKSKSDDPDQKKTKRHSSSSSNSVKPKKVKGKPVLSFDDEENDD